MGRGYALDRCWVARPEALCETCRWFVEDTHPHFQPTIGRDLAERTSSYNKKHRGTETAKVVYLCELAEDVQDSVTMDDDEDDECDSCDGGDSFDAAGAAADADAAASEAPASVVTEEVGPRRGGRARTAVQRD